MREVYISYDELNQIISESVNGIFVFGTGVDAERLCAELDVKRNIIAFVDNRRSGKGTQYLGKNVINVDQLLETREGCQPVIIATCRFAKEISGQLEEKGLFAGKDFFVWDDWMQFHYDSITKEYIPFLREIWEPHKRRNRSNKILIAFDNKCDLSHIKFAYYANYLAEKYDASIYGYFWWGSDASNASPVVKEIFSAINMEGLIDTALSAEEQKESEQIFCTLWEQLETWKDWSNITLYGINFGTTVIRDFLRTELPDFDLKSERMRRFLKQTVDTIVFWKKYFDHNHVVTVLCGDGVTWEGYIRDIAISQGIPAYEVLCMRLKRLEIDYFVWSSYFHYKGMWNQLSHREKEIAMKWGREYIDEKICRNKKIEAEVDGREGILKKNDKLKLVIYPHIFEEDCYHYGEQIFDNNYFLWLCHLGELSNNTLNYDWYIKMHPAASKRDIMIIDMVREKYPRLQLLPRDTSPLQLKREGVRFALTVNGSIGHEFPLMGIQVINAGRNPHDNFDFTWNPRTKEEYDSLILHLNDLKQKIDEMGLIQYYSMEYLIYDKKRLYFDNLFFEKDYLAMLNDTLPQVGKKPGTWMYQEYMDDWTQEQHEFAYNKLGQAFQMADEWKSDILYKTTVFLELCREK